MNMPLIDASSSPVNRRFDGRRLRSERTRQLIVEAYLELVQQTRRMPTAAEIAQRAGYSVRSIFERFSDLNALSLASADHAIALGQAEAVARDVEGDRQSRILSHVDTRAEACERWLPLWRVLTAPDSQEQVSALRVRVIAVRRANVERLELMYRPELATLDGAAREHLILALATLTSFESWDQMRNDFGHSLESGRDIWRSAIDRLLPTTP